MIQSGYYEIVQHAALHTDLKAHIIVGNVIFNRMHWHDSLEILYSVYGGLRVDVDGVSYPMKEGDILVINGGEHHELTEGIPGGLQFILSIDASLLRLAPGRQYRFSTVGESAIDRQSEEILSVKHAMAEIADIFLSFPAKTGRHFPEGKPLSREKEKQNMQEQLPLAELSAYLQQEEIWYQIHIALYQILLILSRHTVPAGKSQNHTRQYERFSQCMEYIHGHYTEDFGIKELAERIGFSEPTLYRLFQTHMGVTFNQYLNMLRVNTACGILETTAAISMTELAQQCGYNSLSNFYRAFRQLTGQSPGEYRRNHPYGQQKSMSLQKNLLMLNRFQHFGELPYTRADIQKLL